MKIRRGVVVFLIVLAVSLLVWLSLVDDPPALFWSSDGKMAKTVIPPQYELVRNFHESRAAVRRNGHWGYVNPRGEWMLRPTFEAALDFQKNRAPVKQNGRWGVIDPKGRFVMNPRYSRIRSFSEGRAAFRDDGRWGFINRQGDTVVPARFEWVEDFKNGRAVARTNKGTGFLDRTGEWVIEPRFEDAGAFSDGMAPVEKYDLWGYVNRDGEQLVDFRFVWGSPFEGERSRVLTESGWAILGSDFELNHVPDVMMLGTVEESPVPVVGSEGWTFFNPREGRENRFGTYDAILPFAEGLGAVKRGSFWGYVNPDGQEIIEPKFEAAGRFRESRARVKIGGQWGYVAHPERSSNVRAETVPLNVREGPEERTYSDTKLEESLLEEYPTWFHSGRDRYVNVGRGVLERRWHREETVPASSLSFEETLFEVDQFPYEFPDAVQHEAAEELFFRSLAAANRYGWNDYTRAREVGYRPNQEDGTHLHHLENSTDSRVLVPAKPEYLIYYSGGDKNNRRLTGFMYLNKELEGTAPQIGGGLTRWHYHRYSSEKCFRDRLLILHEDEECRRGVRQSRAPEMLHLWFMNHPQGTFGTRMVFFADLLPDWTREYRPKFTP